VVEILEIGLEQPSGVGDTKAPGTYRLIGLAPGPTAVHLYVRADSPEEEARRARAVRGSNWLATDASYQPGNAARSTDQPATASEEVALRTHRNETP
jgi:hypothetical protein